MARKEKVGPDFEHDPATCSEYVLYSLIHRLKDGRLPCVYGRELGEAVIFQQKRFSDEYHQLWRWL